MGKMDRETALVLERIVIEDLVILTGLTYKELYDMKYNRPDEYLETLDKYPMDIKEYEDD